MKNWFTRFGMLAVLGSLVCGLVVAGCGGPEEDTDVVVNAASGAPGAPPVPPAPPAPPADAGDGS